MNIFDYNDRKTRKREVIRNDVPAPEAVAYHEPIKVDERDIGATTIRRWFPRFRKEEE